MRSASSEAGVERHGGPLRGDCDGKALYRGARLLPTEQEVGRQPVSGRRSALTSGE